MLEVTEPPGERPQMGRSGGVVGPSSRSRFHFLSKSVSGFCVAKSLDAWGNRFTEMVPWHRRLAEEWFQIVLW